MQMCFLEGRKVSGLFDIPGMRLEHVSIDLMHVGDFGIVLYLLGMILYELFIEMNGRISDPRTTLSDLQTLIRMASKRIGQTSPPIRDLTMAMIRREKISQIVSESRGINALVALRFVYFGKLFQGRH